MSNYKKYYFQDSFMEAPIKCNLSYPSFTQILEALYVMIYEGAQVYTSPRGYHVRLRFTEKMTSSTFSARLSTFYKRKSGYIPMRITVAECDEDESGLHHHYSIILNDKRDRKASLQHFMSQLFEAGFLADYKITCPDSDIYGHHIRSLEEKDSYFKWMTYLAKVSTKAKNGQVWSPCRAVSRAVKKWKLAGKPDLRKQQLSRNQADISLTVDILTACMTT